MTGDERMAICQKCPLYSVGSYGPICNNSLYINKEGKTSGFPKIGYTKGCGCKLNMKTKNPNSHCIVGKW